MNQKRKSKGVVVKLATVEVNMNPYGFHHYACDYLKAANQWKGNESYSPVPYFLYCRAIELGLKSYLLAKGKKLAWIKSKIVHDLNKALNHAKVTPSLAITIIQPIS